MTPDELLEMIYVVANELEYRQTTGKCFMFLPNGTWNEVCEKGIEYFQALKNEEKDYVS